MQREDELMHYGVVGMRWGITKAKYKVAKKYHNFRANRNENLQARWHRKASNSKAKSFLNPSYLLKTGLEDFRNEKKQAHQHLADAYETNIQMIDKGRKFSKKFIDKYDENYSDIQDNIVSLGEDFVKMYIK